MDEIFSWFIRSAVLAPRGRPLPKWLDAFLKAYHRHELNKCFSADKKLTPLTAARINRLNSTTGGIIT